MTAGEKQPQEKFKAAFGALELIEQGYLKETQLDDDRMGTKYLFMLVSSIRKQVEKAEKDAREKSAKAIKDAELATQAAQRAKDAKEKSDREAQQREAQRAIEAKDIAEKSKREAELAKTRAEQVRKAVKPAGRS
jgi:hypothetical protein